MIDDVSAAKKMTSFGLETLKSIQGENGWMCPDFQMDRRQKFAKKIFTLDRNKATVAGASPAAPIPERASGGSVRTARCRSASVSGTQMKNPISPENCRCKREGASPPRPIRRRVIKGYVLFPKLIFFVFMRGFVKLKEPRLWGHN